jgi:cytochrome c
MTLEVSPVIDRLGASTLVAMAASLALGLSGCGKPETAGEAPAEVAPAAEEPQAGGTASSEEPSATVAASAPPREDLAEAALADAPPPDAGGGATENAAGGGAALAQYAALSGDAAKGKKAFVKCMACHTVEEGQNRVGPSLFAIIGRRAGAVDKFRYSNANKNSNLVWTEETMFEYLENPQKFMPGTLMAFPGVPAPQERADLIAYLKSVSP